MLGTLTTHCRYLRYVQCLAGMFITLFDNRKLWKISKSKRWNRALQAMVLLRF